MGWASGSELLGDIVSDTQKLVVDKKVRKKLYAEFIKVFECHDCDTMDEIRGTDPVFDKALDAHYDKMGYR